MYEFAPGAAFESGPFAVRTWLLPHWEVAAARAGYDGDVSVAVPAVS